MRYFIRAIKYFIFICVLYIGLTWLANVGGMVEQDDVWVLLQAQLNSQRGLIMVVGFVLLAAFYPRFGFMTGRVEGYDAERDHIRLINAMLALGFSLKGEVDGVMLFRAQGPLRRIGMLLEDEIEVRVVDDGLEIKGLRRNVARICYMLKTYMHNSRYDD